MSTELLECIDSDEGNCKGVVEEYYSRSGATVSPRCVAHQSEYERRMDKVYEGVNERYPGWQNPGSVAPAWFDPSYAGESWDEDY